MRKSTQTLIKEFLQLMLVFASVALLCIGFYIMSKLHSPKSAEKTEDYQQIVEMENYHHKAGRANIVLFY